MRKDVRFGLIIAGILLAAFIVWAALFPRGGDKSSPVAMEPATQPADASSAQQPTITSSPDLDNRSTMVSDAGPATQPSGANDWTMLLATGGAATTQPASAWGAVPADAAPLPTFASATTRPSVAAGTHKVQSGETFFTIAAAVYGDSKYFTRLEDANPTVNPNRLRIGTVINVPDLSAPLAVRTAAYEARPAADVRAPVDSSTSYRVKASDTLMGIVRRLYGDGKAWQKIYDANRDAIGPNPARLTVGMVLRLPEPPTMASAN